MTARAATLQISPVMVEMRPNEHASGITLRNPGDKPLYGQVRVFQWDQVDGEDSLVPAQSLAASPPLIEIAPNGEQLVRLVRSAAQPNGVEQSYRVLIDEIPRSEVDTDNSVMIRLRYSIPVFVSPADTAGQAQLVWQLFHRDGHWFLRVDNTGTKHAQIGAVQIVDRTGKAYDISKGLLGYALAGRWRQWQVPLPQGMLLDRRATIRASVNASAAEAVATVVSDK